MKKFLTILLILISYQLNVSAGTKCRTIPNENIYSLEVKPLNNENLCLVTFSLSSDCYVKIKITDPSSYEENYLVNDEMQSGTYNIYYKSGKKITDSKSTYTIEICDSKKEIIYIKEERIPVQ